MRIHLGCGDKYWPGFINVDGFVDADIKCDVTQLEFPSEYATEIHAIHLFEHIDRMEAESALMDWNRVLKPGGTLVLEMPCLDKIAKMIVNGEKNMVKTLFGLYGDVRLKRKEMSHLWCWSVDEITKTLLKCGFVDIKILCPFFHLKDRDMRIEANKP